MQNTAWRHADAAVPALIDLLAKTQLPVDAPTPAKDLALTVCHNCVAPAACQCHNVAISKFGVNHARSGLNLDAAANTQLPKLHHAMNLASECSMDGPMQSDDGPIIAEFCKFGCLQNHTSLHHTFIV